MWDPPFRPPPRRQSPLPTRRAPGARGPRGESVGGGFCSRPFPAAERAEPPPRHSPFPRRPGRWWRGRAEPSLPPGPWGRRRLLLRVERRPPFGRGSACPGGESGGGVRPLPRPSSRKGFWGSPGPVTGEAPSVPEEGRAGWGGESSSRTAAVPSCPPDIQEFYEAALLENPKSADPPPKPAEAAQPGSTWDVPRPPSTGPTSETSPSSRTADTQVGATWASWGGQWAAGGRTGPALHLGSWPLGEGPILPCLPLCRGS